MTRNERAKRILKDAIKDFRLQPYKKCVSYNSCGFCLYIKHHPLMKRCAYEPYMDLICNVDKSRSYWFADGWSQDEIWYYEELSHLKFVRSDWARERLEELEND